MTLPAQAQIIVIGGGIIGCSTAYHLARDHKADVLLLEQGKITSGSTWHAAGLVGQLRSSASITKVLKYSVDLYKGLAAETGLDTGWKMTGCLRLATTPDRWTEFRRLATTAKSFGMEMDLIGPDEVKRMWPLMDTSDLIGASWLPTDGQASPSDITQSARTQPAPPPLAMPKALNPAPTYMLAQSGAGPRMKFPSGVKLSAPLIICFTPTSASAGTRAMACSRC